MPQDWHQCSITAWQRHCTLFFPAKSTWMSRAIHSARQRSAEIDKVWNMELCERPRVIVMSRLLPVWLGDFLLDLWYNSIWNEVPGICKDNTVCLYRCLVCFFYIIFWLDLHWHILYYHVLFSALVFIKCNNLRLYVLHVTWTFCTSSGGKYWLVIIRLDFMV